MIIIKTNNGCVFVNEMETLQVEHDKTAARVEVWLRNPNGGAVPTRFIDNVEVVKYTNKEAEHTDKGSAVEYLEKERTELWKLGKCFREKFEACERFIWDIKPDAERLGLKEKIDKVLDEIQELEKKFEKEMEKQ